MGAQSLTWGKEKKEYALFHFLIKTSWTMGSSMLVFLLTSKYLSIHVFRFPTSSHFGWHHWILSTIFLVFQEGRSSHFQHSDIYTYIVWKFGKDEANRIKNVLIVPAPFLICFCVHSINIELFSEPHMVMILVRLQYVLQLYK